MPITQEKKLRQRLVSRRGIVAVISLTFSTVSWEEDGSLVLWSRKTGECWKQSVKGHCGGSLEDSNAERDTDGETWFTRLQRGRGPPLVTSTGAISVFFWPRV